MTRKTMEFRVRLTPPLGASVSDVKEYIRSALQSERGALHPDDPMSNFDAGTLQVKLPSLRSHGRSSTQEKE